MQTGHGHVLKVFILFKCRDMNIDNVINAVLIPEEVSPQ
jgi:hypothetical protein